MKKIAGILLFITMIVVLSCQDSGERRIEGESPIESEGGPVSAEDGGPGFDGEGWESNDNPVKYGDPRAKKGGSFTFGWSEYPDTLRTEGAQSNQDQISSFGNLIYEVLLGFDLQTMEFSPGLASHWKRAEDDSWYEFRLDPEARWSDGEAVTADDVIATLNLMKDEGIGSPYNNELYARFTAEKLSDYIVRINNADPNWRHFLYMAASTRIYPAHYLEKIDGATYLEKYNDQMLPGTGPYIADMDEVVPGELFVLKRRPDYWAGDKEEAQGVYNFDTIRYLVIRDETIMKEKFKKGDIDLYIVARAQWWVEEFDLADPQPAFDALNRGLVQKRKIFTFDPKGTSGLAFNTRIAPFDDIRMRKAIAMLWDFDTLNATLFFGEYARTSSLYQGTPYMAPDRLRIGYDPAEANRLLDEMGWTGRDNQGYRSNAEGEVLGFVMPIVQILERIFTPLQEDLAKAGIKMELEIVDGSTIWQKVMERRFAVVYQGFTGLAIPNPESSLSSVMADQLNSNNIWGFKSERADELMKEYDIERDAGRRVEIIREIDQIVSESVIWAYGWHAPYTHRVLYWNKFDMPEWGLSYAGDYKGIAAYWWYDPDLDEELKSAQDDSSIRLDYGPQELDYWGVQE